MRMKKILTIEGNRHIPLASIGAREQQRIEEDLHDGICQDLSAVILMTRVLEKNLSKRSPRDARDADEIIQLITKALIMTKLLTKGLLLVESNMKRVRYA